MVSVLASGSRYLGSSPGRDIVNYVLGQNTLLSVRMSTQVYKWVLTNFNAGSTLACSRFMLKKPEINASLIGSYAYFAFHVFKVCPTILEMYRKSKPLLQQCASFSFYLNF